MKKQPHVCEPQKTISGETSLCRCGKDIARMRRDAKAFGCPFCGELMYCYSAAGGGSAMRERDAP